MENNNNDNKTIEKGKKKRKLSKSSGLISDDDSSNPEGGNAPLGISASITAHTSKKGESSTAQTKQQGKKKDVGFSHNHTQKERKTSNGSVKKVADPFRASPLTPKSQQSIEQRQQQILQRQKLLQKSEEKDRDKIEAAIKLREKQNRDIQEQEYQLELKQRRKREAKRLKELERQQEAGSSKDDRTSEEERRKEIEEIKQLLERQRKSEAQKNHQDEPNMGEAPRRKNNSFKLAISDNRSANATPSSSYASNPNRLADGSFTNLKRPLNGKPGGKGKWILLFITEIDFNHHFRCRHWSVG